MSIQAAYWHWLVFGMLLIIAEIFVPSFTIFWFGLAAMVVSGLLLMIPKLGFTWQLFVWAVAACAMTFLWFRFFKPLMVDRTKAGVAKEAIVGQSGQVVKTPINGRNGLVRFPVPLMGTDEWSFFCDESVMLGDRVIVRDISGNDLIVVKASPRGASL